jgi:hypothetical protein
MKALVQLGADEAATGAAGSDLSTTSILRLLVHAHAAPAQVIALHGASLVASNVAAKGDWTRGWLAELTRFVEARGAWTRGRRRTALVAEARAVARGWQRRWRRRLYRWID